MSGLSIQKELFCNEYIIDFNGTQAAIRAKYSAKAAKQQASFLLPSTDIRQPATEWIIEELGTQKEELRLKILRELDIIAFADVTKDINVIQRTETRDGKEYTYYNVEINETKDSKQSKAIAGIKRTDKGVEVKYHDKEKALELLGRFGAMWNDSLDVNITTPETDLSNLTKEELKNLADLNRKRKS